MNIHKFGLVALPLAMTLLSSCFHDDDDTIDYNEWFKENNAYFVDLEADKSYEKVTPAWDPASSILMKWHKKGDPNSITPLDNSTIDVKYLLRNIKGDTLDSSYSNTVYGDSIFRLKPNEMITGFWIATTNMHVGDSVTAVIPFTAGYGVTGSASILPYSTLIFEIKLDSIVNYDSLPWRP